MFFFPRIGHYFILEEKHEHYKSVKIVLLHFLRKIFWVLNSFKKVQLKAVYRIESTKLAIESTPNFVKCFMNAEPIIAPLDVLVA
ncbi:hypothetical protein LCGC14_1114900 [marine sediment metagenome]|uniref:Uncharacterized protein n=1 Tax=marine sediment metagenome TaxID=412755 RepID=A0A0F9MAF1_9ZZZZ